ncbi:MAG: lysophospholipid acyltransferase family protein [Alkalispirochaetaceae bacterium]
MDYYLSRNWRHTVIGGLRALIRLHYFTIVFVFGSVVALAARSLLPERTYRRLRPTMARKLARVLLYASNIRIRHHGMPPAPGSFIVSNHLSWADTFTYLGELGCRFLATHLYGQIVGFGVILRSLGVSFVNRMSLRAIGSARRVVQGILRRGESLLIFPEGRTSRGGGIRPFKAAFLQVAVDLGLPVSWAAVRYETPPGWPPASVVVGWEEWPPLITHIYRAFHAHRIICRIRYGQGCLEEKDRRTLAESLHAVVSRYYEPMEQLAEETLRKIDVFKKVSQPRVYGESAHNHGGNRQPAAGARPGDSGKVATASPPGAPDPPRK